MTPSVAAPGDTNLCDTTASMHRAVTNIEIGLFIEIFHHSKKHNYKPVGDEAGAANSAGQEAANKSYSVCVAVSARPSPRCKCWCFVKTIRPKSKPEKVVLCAYLRLLIKALEAVRFGV